MIKQCSRNCLRVCVRVWAITAFTDARRVIWSYPLATNDVSIISDVWNKARGIFPASRYGWVYRYEIVNLDNDQVIKYETSK